MPSIHRRYYLALAALLASPVGLWLTTASVHAAALGETWPNRLFS